MILRFKIAVFTAVLLYRFMHYLVSFQQMSLVGAMSTFVTFVLFPNMQSYMPV